MDQLNSETYHHKSPLTEAGCEVIELSYQDLSNRKLLKRCLHGKNQNPNDSFNAAIWQSLSKTVFVGLETLKLGVYDAVIGFIEDSVGKINVLQRLKITPCKFTILGLLWYWHHSNEKSPNENNKKRTARGTLKMKIENEEDVGYCSGGF